MQTHLYVSPCLRHCPSFKQGFGWHICSKINKNNIRSQSQIAKFLRVFSETFLGACQTSMMELFAKTGSIIDIWLSPKLCTKSCTSLLFWKSNHSRDSKSFKNSEISMTQSIKKALSFSAIHEKDEHLLNPRKWSSFWLYVFIMKLYAWSVFTALRMKFFIKDFFSKCDQIRIFLLIWSHLLKKSLVENFIFCVVVPFL